MTRLSRPLTRPLTRRQRALQALLAGDGLPRPAGVSPRIAVVGAGLAGLTAAHLLATAGCTVAVFEAATRVGGRIRTDRGPTGTGPVWELGGEFIDGDHDDIHALAAFLGLEVFDTLPRSERALAAAYRFGGQPYSEDQVDDAWRGVADRVAADVAAVGARPTWRHATPAARRFDHLSLADYLDTLPMDRWLRQLLEVAYVTVYGGTADAQSALNLLTLIGTTPDGGLALFGRSDERYKLRGGSAGLTDGLAARLGRRVHLGCRLVRVARAGVGWRLAFARDAGATAEVPADAVVLALPFSTLRAVEMPGVLPPVQRRAVDALGYGTSSKVLLGLQRPVWRAQGFEGGSYSDLPLQTTWDASRLRGDGGTVFTCFLGGDAGLAVGHGNAAAHAARHLGWADTLFPGTAAAATGASQIAHWPGEPFARGAYTSYRPGQWTAFAGAEGTPVTGGLYFAGEHCAAGSQGYMNGAAQTGRRAAMAILRR